MDSDIDGFKMKVEHYRYDNSGELRRYYRTGKNYFEPMPKGGMTLVRIEKIHEEIPSSGEPLSLSGHYGVSLCDEGDYFCYQDGFKRAKKRALDAYHEN